MKNSLRICKVLIILAGFILFPLESSCQGKAKFALVIHGGAGTISPRAMTRVKEMQYRQKLREALEAGYKVLEENGSSLDAVIAVINIMEDSPLFNAGKGAVFTYERTNELDASIMDGNTMQAGAVAGVQHIKNPISLARLVMEKSPHVLLTGKGAEGFAADLGIKMMPGKYFFTRRRLKQLEKIQNSKKKVSSISASNSGYKFGTVGCAALDKAGNLAAGTSTGGMTNKRYGRVGDSPLIGAGTYANNKTCAVSSTGHGEFFIRYAVAHDISALMEYKGMSLKDAADFVVNKKLKDVGGSGGIIAIDRQGNIAMPFNTTGMYRGYKKSNGETLIKIFKDLK
jgi:beta-aspartyl-peptidase (threonine type)